MVEVYRIAKRGPILPKNGLKIRIEEELVKIINKE